MKRSDIELGDKVEVQRKPRAGVVISARLTSEEADRLEDYAESVRRSLSQVAREAVLAFLDAGGLRPKATPWTGTASAGARFELVYGGLETIAQTTGRAEQSDPEKLVFGTV